MSASVLIAEILYPLDLWAVSMVSRLPEEKGEEDEALTSRAKQGDRQAFDLLFKRHVDEVYGRLSRLIGPDPEREDLVQEVFVAAFKGLSKFRGEATFSTWLYRIVVHVAYGHLRKRKRRPITTETWEDLDFAADALSPEAVADRKEQVTRALAFLDRLKPKKRIAFVLRVVEGRSLQEISQIVDAKPAAVGQRVKFAQRELDAMFAREEKRAQ